MGHCLLYISPGYNIKQIYGADNTSKSISSSISSYIHTSHYTSVFNTPAQYSNLMPNTNTTRHIDFMELCNVRWYGMLWLCIQTTFYLECYVSLCFEKRYAAYMSLYILYICCEHTYMLHITYLPNHIYIHMLHIIQHIYMYRICII